MNSLRESLKDYLQKPYESIESFLDNVIFPVFGEEYFETAGNDNLLRRYPDIKAKADDSGILSIINVGRILIEGSELAIYDITVSSQRQLSRSRVAIQDVIRKIIGTYSGAFMIFHYKTMEGRWDWRFTFCHKGASHLDSTDAKRYTFLLGPSQSCRTAADNFLKIHDKIEKEGEFEMDDIVRAFDVEALSKEFFNKYKVFYAEFVAYMCDEANGMRQDFITTDFDHKGLTSEQIKDKEEKPIRDYIKKLLGRLVFLQFLQKKGWMGVPAGKAWGEGDYDFLRQLFLKSTPEQKANFLDGVLEPLFSALDNNRPNCEYDTHVPGIGLVKVPYLNGGLFERDRYDEPDTVFPSDFFGRLLEFFYEYNFTIDENDPNDAEVGIDAEMLGKIFENLLEDNKDKGAFYTPKEIVQYMCRECLIAYLQTGIQSDEAKQELRDFVLTNKIEVLQHVDCASVDNALQVVKICDPAIGSGAFPMGLLRELYNCRQALEPNADLSLLKKEIICNNIYGVDIEKGAIDIARLRFWLAIIVDAEKPEALPNFDYKFMQGNSLLESFEGFDLSRLAENKDSQSSDCAITLFDNEFDLTKKDLQDLTKEFFATSDHQKKSEIRQKIDQIVVQFIKDSTYGNKKVLEALRSIDMNNKPFFLWHLNFQEVFADGGFDIVIGNPPYISAPAQLANGGLTKQRNDIVASRKYNSLYQKWDLYIPFMELGIRHLCRMNGIMSMIVPYPLINQLYSQRIREMFTRDYNLFELVDLNGTKIFENATVSNCIPFVRKCEPEGTTFISHIQENKIITRDFVQAYSDLIQDESKYVWNLSQEKKEVNRHPNFKVLGDYCYISVGMVLNADEKVAKGAFKKDDLLSNTKDEIHCRKYIEGKDIDKYCELSHKYLEYGTDRCPGKVRRKTFPELYQVPKLMTNQLGQLKTILDDSNFYCTNHQTRMVILWKDLKGVENKSIESSIKKFSSLSRDAMESLSFSVDLKYLLGLLNSKYCSYLLSIIRCGDICIYPEHIRCIPIAPASPVDQKKIVDLVDKIMSAKKSNPSANTSIWENAINEKIYSLYGLSDDEIAIVEGTN